jgi:hypothetical protein
MAERAAAERARSAAAPRNSTTVSVKASPANSSDSGPPLYMPVQHRPGDHGAVPSVGHPRHFPLLTVQKVLLCCCWCRCSCRVQGSVFS